MPQLDAVSYLPQVFWVVIRFFAFYVRVAKGILPLIGRVLWTRELKRTNASAQLGEAGSVEKEMISAREEILKSGRKPFLMAAEEVLRRGVKKEEKDLKTLWRLTNSSYFI